ncbi:MAG: DUF2236 domain-containing protein [Deltaproteobacteria bacterium]|nr:MAG: DUF2236 domain-containing protein [Deltaproteobacteria bacterium]TMQ19979.1 MAG: DUF2236 domain-containing protein [Deltaproteobacteria bacterium]
MIVTRADLEASLAELRPQIPEPRAGLFGPRSTAWRIGGDVAVFLGGGRAALLQLAHPMVAHAIAQHSHTRADVAGRFQRTFRHVFAMVFGDLDDAFAAARRVHAIHTTIHGEIPEAVGGWPAGAPYHANDADALRWVHATLVDTTLVVREQLDGPLPEALKDDYVVEMNRFAALFGIPHALRPRSHREHAAYMRDMIASDRIAVAPCARDMARFLIGRGGARQPPLGRITEAVTAELLPARLAAAFELRAAPRRSRLGLAAFGRLHRRVPEAVRGIPARSEAQRRLAGLPPSRLDVWAERRLFGLARRATGDDGACRR